MTLFALYLIIPYTIISANDTEKVRMTLKNRISYTTYRGDIVEDLKKAYELLGLPEFSDKEEVEKRYTLLLRQSRARAKQQPESNEDESFEQVTKAYKAILEYEKQKDIQAFNEQEYGKYRGMADKAQKIDHFWRYYKYHTLGVIAAIALIIYGIFSYMDHLEEKERIANLPPASLEISFMGNYYMKQEVKEEDALETALLPMFPEWERYIASLTTIPKDDASKFAYLQKAVILLASEKPDVYIADKETFLWIGINDMFVPLDDLIESGELKGLVSEDQMLKYSTESVPAEHVYGIDLSKTKLAKDLPLYEQELFIGIRVDSQRKDNALHFIKKYLQTSP